MKVQQKFTPRREAQIQSTAELIFKWLQQLPSPADAAAALAMAQCALIMGQRPKDESDVREKMRVTTEGIVDMWKQQQEPKQETMQ
jgi:hypothetical protein